MRRILLAVLGAAAFAVAITPAAAQYGNGNTGTWSTLTGGTAPPPYTFEGRLYGGWADANTFGWNVNSGVFGVGGALRIPIGQFRWTPDSGAKRAPTARASAIRRSLPPRLTSIG